MVGFLEGKTPVQIQQPQQNIRVRLHPGRLPGNVKSVSFGEASDIADLRQKIALEEILFQPLLSGEEGRFTSSPVIREYTGQQVIRAINKALNKKAARFGVVNWAALLKLENVTAYDVRKSLGCEWGSGFTTWDIEEALLKLEKADLVERLNPDQVNPLKQLKSKFMNLANRLKLKQPYPMEEPPYHVYRLTPSGKKALTQLPGEDFESVRQAVLVNPYFQIGETSYTGEKILNLVKEKLDDNMLKQHWGVCPEHILPKSSEHYRTLVQAMEELAQYGCLQYASDKKDTYKLNLGLSRFKTQRVLGNLPKPYPTWGMVLDEDNGNLVRKRLVHVQPDIAEQYRLKTNPVELVMSQVYLDGMRKTYEGVSKYPHLVPILLRPTNEVDEQGNVVFKVTLGKHVKP